MERIINNAAALPLYFEVLGYGVATLLALAGVAHLLLCKIHKYSKAQAFT